MIAEYYCKKLAGKNADHAGAIIHPSIGGREHPAPARHLVPEIEANVRRPSTCADLVNSATRARRR